MSIKRLHYIIIYIIITSICSLKAQTLEEICKFDLPVMIINTVNGEIPTCEKATGPGGFGTSKANATKVPCSITIRQNDEILYDSGEYKEDKSGAKISIRGNITSTSKHQKPYKLKLQKKADLLLRGDDSKYKDKEWVLLRQDSLKAFIGLTVNKLVNLPYQPEFKPINVFMNNGYIGLYYLVESVKRNEKCRINVDKETGYIFEYDLFWWNCDYYVPVEFDDTAMGFTFKYPDEDDITKGQKSYIEQWLSEMQYAIMDGHAEDYLCMDTCARWILARDLIGNGDGLGSNLYFAKEDNTAATKAYPPCLWDFDGVCKKSNDWSTSQTFEGTFFWFLFNYKKNTAFATAYCKEWLSIYDNDVTGSLIQSLKEFADSKEGKSFEISYNLTRNKFYGKSNWSITEQVDEYEKWFKAREEWLYKAMYNRYPKIISYLKYKYIFPDSAFDITGKKIPSTYTGIKILDGKKYFWKF